MEKKESSGASEEKKEGERKEKKLSENWRETQVKEREKKIS